MINALKMLRGNQCRMFFFLALVTPAIASDLVVNRNNIVGSYVYSSGDIGYEEFELMADGSFTSWLHQRPEVTGEWSLIGNTITVREQTGTIQIFSVNSLSKSKMEIRYRGLKTSAIYLKQIQTEKPAEQSNAPDM